ncbi:xanthine dehydrogenase molybdopterin binding subunit [Phaeovulum vinaykumarii]|uniref:Xanthine dehydrogenase, molybdenum binding subunit apoprotein n=1 Tax=Phaeovulum vinaykumarii TaxID=407234 RepID=A0A1N7LGC9_9RHOB|nr:xanthine dehydrogenase molybdopterin binding subunit [Phaeovulum vinaykumarii]SIS72880.1 xanthine dehydrogenase, molybdenum binding subunit apoprotein [Phaeovulum vinaykumarii]SOC04548.1 xanthine dehydrogenase molybdenum binding subunit apoprotein [Phaeovulum vinaykumarii]
MSIGKPLPHDAAQLSVTGRARYLDDLPCPAGTLHLAFGLSDVAHGRITGMDLAAVRAAPDVVAVLTAADIPGHNDVSPNPLPEPLLAEAEVHFAGQALFLVVARSHMAARRAARLGRVEITPLPAIVTLDQALAAGSHFEGGPIVWQSAPPDFTGLEILEGRIEVGGQEHFYLEGQAALALPDEDGMTVQSSTQHPTEVQHKVADALGWPLARVRVEVGRMGGAFGGKESQANGPAVAAALAAHLTGRPCKIRLDRDDDMRMTGKRHEIRIDYRAGLDASGRIRALDLRHMLRCGWSADLSAPVADRAMLHAANAYDIPALRIESHRLRTNTQSATAFRGFGGPQGMMGIERVLAHVAHRTGREPLALRRAHLLAAGQATHYGQELDEAPLPAILDALEARADYAARRAAIARWNAENPILKRGLAISPVMFGISFTLTHLNQAGALVNVYTDGTVALSHGGTEMGQGLNRKIAQIAATAFGIAPEAVRITPTDTAKVPNTSATAASSGTDLNGAAVAAACARIRARLAAMLAAKWGCAPEEIAFEDGKVRADTHAMPFAAAAKAAWEARISLSATGFHATPGLDWNRKTGRGRPFHYFVCGAAATEVVLDILTGEARVLAAHIVHDAGASLNPALDRGQIEGGYVQGLGWLTCEELVWDAAGQLRTHSPSTYKIPAVSDMPGVLDVALWPGGAGAPAIHRARAVGEPPFMLAISAHLALLDACAACGPHWPDLQAPATPEALLAAVARARGEGDA